jgi:pimeloyl-ACP methyl ester carboxylesterase
LFTQKATFFSLGGKPAILVLGVALFGLFQGSPAVTAQAIEETTLKVEIGGHTYSLDAVIVKPAANAGRLPVALITHGSPRDSADRPKRHAREMLPQALDLAHRGWLAVAFTRRGFGGSDGPFAEGYGDCKKPNYSRALATAAEDIAAVHRAVSMWPEADTTRFLGLGVSVGGASMLAWAASRPEGLVGIINIAGGTGSFAQGKNCDESQLVSTVASFGAQARVPTLWLYAENDGYFGPDVVRSMHAGFAKHGGTVELAVLGPIGSDGHDLWWRFDGRLLWLPQLDRFLRAWQLPTWDNGPFDKLTERLNPDARRVLARYLAGPVEKAISISRVKGLARWSGGMPDLEAARRKSLELCEGAASEACDIIVENFSMVSRLDAGTTAPTPTPPK